MSPSAGTPTQNWESVLSSALVVLILPSIDKGLETPGFEPFCPPNPTLKIKDSVLIALGCLNKSPQIWWLQTTGIYSLPVLEARSPTPGVAGRVGCFWRLWGQTPASFACFLMAVLGGPRRSLERSAATPASASLSTWPSASSPCH